MITKTVLVLLLIILTGCSSNPIVEKPTVLRDKVPSEMTELNPVPKFQGETNGDLVDWALELKGELIKCNNNKTSIRKWSDEQ